LIDEARARSIEARQFFREEAVKTILLAIGATLLSAAAASQTALYSLAAFEPASKWSGFLR
jgi:hypothetical protein